MKATVVSGWALLMLMLCSAALTLAQDVHYNYDRDTDFSVYKTYQWSQSVAPRPTDG